MNYDPDPFDLPGALARIPRLRRPPAYVRAWYARYALLYGVMVPAGLVELGVTAHPVAPAGVVVATGLAYLATPEFRRWAHGQALCVWAERRVRTALLRGRIAGPDGRPPVVSRVVPAPFGVLVHVRCPIGMRVATVLRARDVIHDATGAAGVTMVHEPGHRVVVIGLQYPPAGRWWEG